MKWLEQTELDTFPYRPIWPGFALNTLFYAALLWLLFLLAPRQIRRHVRVRRGLCPACGYPVGESAVCSECGTPRRRSVGGR